jgi:hypothetical protein
MLQSASLSRSKLASTMMARISRMKRRSCSDFRNTGRCSALGDTGLVSGEFWAMGLCKDLSSCSMAFSLTAGVVSETHSLYGGGGSQVLALSSLVSFLVVDSEEYPGSCRVLVNLKVPRGPSLMVGILCGFWRKAIRCSDV